MTTNINLRKPLIKGLLVRKIMHLNGVKNEFGLNKMIDHSNLCHSSMMHFVFFSIKDFCRRLLIKHCLLAADKLKKFIKHWYSDNVTISDTTWCLCHYNERTNGGKKERNFIYSMSTRSLRNICPGKAFTVFKNSIAEDKWKSGYFRSIYYKEWVKVKIKRLHAL